MPKHITYALEVIALVAFAFALFLLWHDKTSSAGVAVVLSFGAILFRMLPDLEYIEILSLKAKLRNRLEEAEHVLVKLRGVASI